jgi:hypothetical protein
MNPNRLHELATCQQCGQGYDDVTIGGKLPRWAILVGVASVGLLLIIVPSIYEWQSEYGIILREIGIALLSASIVGITIDRWLKADLAKDIFEAAIGWPLRPELKDEILKIAYSEWIAIKALLIVRISVVNKNIVKIDSSMERELLNVTNTTKKIGAWDTVDEWGVPGYPSNVEECHLVGDGFEYAGEKQESPGPHSLVSGTKETKIKPGRTVTFRYRNIEYKKLNDLLYWTWLSPTVDQVVEVISPDEIDFVIRPGRDGEVKKEGISTRTTIKGTLLPYQHLGVRWWPKNG